MFACNCLAVLHKKACVYFANAIVKYTRDFVPKCLDNENTFYIFKSFFFLYSSAFELNRTAVCLVLLVKLRNSLIIL